MALLKANTGIGTTNPTSALHVVGDLLFTGDIKRNGTLFSQNIPESTNTTLAASDVGGYVKVTNNVTVPNSVFSAGDAVSVYNNSASQITISAAGTLRLGGTSGTGTRYLANYGLATVLCIGSNQFVATGVGLT